MPYKLSATLQAHSSDVRALAAPTNNLILSASRDSSAIAWKRAGTSQAFTPETTFHPSDRYINAVAYLRTESQSKHFLVTGGQDCLVNVLSLDPPKDSPVFSLVGHTNNVCALSVTPGGAILSGSWDSTARLWRDFQLAYELKGHSASVLSVLALNEEQFITGSADKTIKLWQTHKAVNTFTGHTDAVRGLAVVPDVGFASCSNDGEIRVWTLGGDQVYTLTGHSSFVYSIATLPGGGIVSSGEDRTARIWKDGECAQIITHPAISVWTITVLPNGDIVTGASDKMIRIFSKDEVRWAPAEETKAFEDLVASQTLPSQLASGTNENLPGPEVLSKPGNKAGEYKRVKNGNVIEVYQWDSSMNQWQKIGDQVDHVGSGQKKMFDGKEWDYVFDVDIQDGVPPLKLPYNANENPYTAAQRFLAKNDLSMSYLDQVAKFIEQQATPISIGTSNDEYIDPFTGASRYKSTAATSASSIAPSAYSDPFTGSSRYISTASPSSAHSQPPSTHVDPFTGNSRYMVPPAPVLPSARTEPKMIPIEKFELNLRANIDPMQTKLHQVNEALRNEITTATLAMYPDEQISIEEIFDYITGISTLGACEVAPLTPSHAEALIQILERWPAMHVFPLIDLTRLVTGYSWTIFDSTGLKDRLFASLFAASECNEPWTPPISRTREVNLMLTLRVLANLFHETSDFNDVAWLEKVLDEISKIPRASMNKKMRVILATIDFNLSCVALKTPMPPSLRSRVLLQILSIVEYDMSDSEAIQRALVALGNLLYAAKGSGISEEIDAARLTSAITALPTRYPEARIETAAKEVLNLLKL
ncbi:phospholipase A-2-activating protein [Fistulina hepatica ATCC 64428]|nr:phospholipase A-2-activating protein [Fistulina hepatica ATCC 64428]